jgi:hypothetical protein
MSIVSIVKSPGCIVRQRGGDQDAFAAERSMQRWKHSESDA